MGCSLINTHTRTIVKKKLWHRLMIRQRFALFLILLMVLTPVSSVFAHYSSIANSLVAEQVIVASIDLTGAMATQNADQCHQHTKVKSVCNTDASCSFHLCGHGVLATSFSFSYAYNPYRYANLAQIVFTSRFFSPAIKPPIDSLRV